MGEEQISKIIPLSGALVLLDEHIFPTPFLVAVEDPRCALASLETSFSESLKLRYWLVLDWKLRLFSIGKKIAEALSEQFDIKVVKIKKNKKGKVLYLFAVPITADFGKELTGEESFNEENRKKGKELQEKLEKAWQIYNQTIEKCEQIIEEKAREIVSTLKI